MFIHVVILINIDYTAIYLTVFIDIILSLCYTLAR